MGGGGAGGGKGRVRISQGFTERKGSLQNAGEKPIYTRAEDLQLLNCSPSRKGRHCHK